MYNTALFTIYNKLCKNVESCDFECHFTFNSWAVATIEKTDVVSSFVKKKKKKFKPGGYFIS